MKDTVKRILALIGAIAVLILFLVLFVVPAWSETGNSSQELIGYSYTEAMIFWESQWNSGVPIFYGFSDLVHGYLMLSCLDFNVVDADLKSMRLADVPNGTRVEILFTGDIDDSYPAIANDPILLRLVAED